MPRALTMPIVEFQTIRRGQASASPLRPPRSLKTIALASAFLLLAGKPQASSPPAPEYKIKAAYLLNFARFVEWPSSAFVDERAPIIIGIVGEDPFGEAIEETVKGNTVGGRTIGVKRFRQIGDIDGCHVLFVSRSLEKEIKEVLRRLGSRLVATVGECDHFAGLGGIFGFFVKENKVRFEVNVDAAKRAGLKISAKLIQVGTVVRDDDDR
jgi:hypothetical protein